MNYNLKNKKLKVIYLTKKLKKCKPKLLGIKNKSNKMILFMDSDNNNYNHLTLIFLTSILIKI